MSVRLVCSGTGAPTVVLLPGGDDPIDVWDGLVAGLGEDTRTCAFEYPDAPVIDEPITPQIVADTLEGALTAAGEASPYVVVGHSLAGLSVRVFVGAHPEQISGVVLFDPTPVEIIEDLAPELEQTLNWDAEATIKQASAITSWPDVPVRILESDPRVERRTGRSKERWHQGQQAYAALAPHGRLQVVRDAEHMIFHGRLDAALDAIEAVIDEAADG